MNSNVDYPETVVSVGNDMTIITIFKMMVMIMMMMMMVMITTTIIK